jgi:hypothetical protein
VKLKIKILTVFGSLVLMAFALNVGTASADTDSADTGIATAAAAIGIEFGVVFDAVPEGSPAKSGSGTGGPLGGPLLVRNPLCPAYYGGLPNAPWYTGP